MGERGRPRDNRWQLNLKSDPSELSCRVRTQSHSSTKLNSFPVRARFCVLRHRQLCNAIIFSLSRDSCLETIGICFPFLAALSLSPHHIHPPHPTPPQLPSTCLGWVMEFGERRKLKFGMKCNEPLHITSSKHAWRTVSDRLLSSPLPKRHFDEIT